MLMSMGRGHNISTIVQTLGRATFNGKNILAENGFDCVRVLLTSNDYTLCVKVQNYINQVHQRIQKGDTFAEAVTGAVSHILIFIESCPLLQTYQLFSLLCNRMRKSQTQPTSYVTHFESFDESKEHANSLKIWLMLTMSRSN